jgi:CheY-like chemotaxis protein
MSPRIFIVDDDDLNRDFIAEIVTAIGFSNIRIFSDPIAVLSAVDSGDFPSLIVSDFNMPGLNGISLLNTLSFVSCSFSGIIVTSDEQAALNRSDTFPVFNKTSENFIEQLSDFISNVLNKTILLPSHRI